MRARTVSDVLGSIGWLFRSSDDPGRSTSTSAHLASGGVALGFGAQSLVRDLLAGLFVLIEDQYGVGDVVDVGPATGTIERVTLRSTRLRDVAGTVWHVPNGEIVRAGNQSQRFSRALIDVTVANDADLAVAERIVASVGTALADDEEWSDRLLGVPSMLGVQALDAHGTTLRLVVTPSPHAVGGGGTAGGSRGLQAGISVLAGAAR
jgi:small conductance mechanosensitive channel